MKETISLATSDLKKSLSNVRKGHSKEDIHTMANSIKARGIINPPTVAKNGDGRYEVIAGQLRVAGAIAAGLKTITCIDLTGQDEQEKVALSLSENVIRRQMSSIEKYRAFNQLFKAGTSIEDIAKEFSVDIAKVQQLLAIGSLPKKILDLAEHGDIGDNTLEALAIAPRSDVTRYSKLKPNERPSDYQIKNWLRGESGWYRLEAAFFDPDLYKGPTVKDLFDDDAIWCTDGDEFIRLQEKAIKQEVDKLTDLGWKCKRIDWFGGYEYDKVSKKEGGEVFYTVSDRTAEVQFHKGYRRKTEAGPARAEPAKGEKAEKPEISQAFVQYLRTVRHHSVCAFMAQNRSAGLVTTLTLLLKEVFNCRDNAPRLSDAYSDSVHSGDNYIFVHDEWTAMLTELGLKDGHMWEIDSSKIAKKLMQYTDKQLIEWIVLATASLWYVDSHSDKIAKELGLTVVNNWEADDAFWNGIKNKATLIAIAKENKIAVVESDKAAKIRATLKQHVPNSWRPSWLKF